MSYNISFKKPKEAGHILIKKSKGSKTVSIMNLDGNGLHNQVKCGISESNQNHLWIADLTQE